MIYWMITLVFALLVVVGKAAGLVGAAISVFAFLAALFLFSAMKIGYREAWTGFALDRFVEPLLKTENWGRLLPIFEDLKEVFIAGTVAVVLVALSLTLPADVVLAVTFAVAGSAFFEVYRANRKRTELSAPKLISYAEAAE